MQILTARRFASAVHWTLVIMR